MSVSKRSRTSRSVAAITATCASAFLVAAVVFGVCGSASEAPADPSLPQVGLGSSAIRPLADTGTTGGQPGSPDVGSSRASLPYKPGEVLVKVLDRQDAESLTAALARVDYLPAQSVGSEDIALGWTALSLDEGQDVEQVAAQLVSDGVVGSAQPDYIYSLEGAAEPDGGQGSLVAGATSLKGDEVSVQAFTLPDYDEERLDGTKGHVDDYTARSWNYTPTINDTYAGEQWWYDAVNGQSAYLYARDTLHLDPSSVNRPSVAVLDSGASLQHEDLEASIEHWYDAVNDAVPSRGDFADARSSTNYHGTHVAGIIAATVNNGKGIAGVSGGAGVVPVRVADENGQALTMDIVRGYRYVVSHASEYNIKVVNLSLGIDVETGGYPDSAWKDAIAEASRQGILTVAAAGNEAGFIDPNGFYNIERGAYPDYPTYFSESTIGVASLWLRPIDNGSGDARTPPELSDLGRVYYSNYNTSAKVKSEQLAAPGNKVASTVGATDGYAVMSGTSMATPVISGVSALVRWANPRLTPDETKSVLYSTAYDIKYGQDGIFDDYTTEGFDSYTGFGCVDAYEAVVNCGNFLEGPTSTSTSTAAAITLIPNVDNTRAAGVWTWESKDPGIATVSSAGVVTGVSGGAAVITATSPDSTVVLRQIVTVHDASLTGVDSIDDNGSAVLTFADSPLDNGTWTWSSSNTGVLNVSASGNSVTVSGVSAGTATVIGTLSSNPGVTVTKAITVNSTHVPDPEPGSGPEPTPVATQVMHRMYNPNSGEHFYTASDGERDMLRGVGWRYEGTGWTAPQTSDTPVFRLYNANAGDHHYTSSPAERDMLRRVGWRYEGIGWYSDDAKTTPLYREYNPNAKTGSHNYTTNLAEHNYLCRIGWRGEGIGWYGL